MTQIDPLGEFEEKVTLTVPAVSVHVIVTVASAPAAVPNDAVGVVPEVRRWPTVTPSL